eukprot:scaffold193_cov255-Pinguiococcus_pyrenoidosus.AAC.6
MCSAFHGADATRIGSASQYFAINGFYPTMRQKFTSDDASVTVLVVEFNRADCPWKRFRTEVIGSTDPEKAAPGSIRGQIFSRWKELGISRAPNVGDNGVHASAGPLEAIRELKLWAGEAVDASRTPLEVGTCTNMHEGCRVVVASLIPTASQSELLKLSNVDEATLQAWLADGEMELNGEQDSAFDLTEEMDSDALLEGLNK